MHKVGRRVDGHNKLGQFNVFRKIKAVYTFKGEAERSGKCQVLGMQDYTRQKRQKQLTPTKQLKNHTSGVEKF